MIPFFSVEKLETKTYIHSLSWILEEFCQNDMNHSRWKRYWKILLSPLKKFLHVPGGGILVLKTEIKMMTSSKLFDMTELKIRKKLIKVLEIAK